MTAPLSGLFAFVSKNSNVNKGDTPTVPLGQTYLCY